MQDACVITDMVLGVILEDDLNQLNKLAKEQRLHPLSVAITTSVMVGEVTNIRNINDLRNYLMSNELTPKQANKRISQSLFRATNQIN